jgi:secondary thiamine-phosphate synthase enzyme
MTVITKDIRLQTRGACEMIDITAEVSQAIAESSLDNGTATIFIPGSTAGITTIEYEEGVLHDFQDMWDRSVPRNITYQHDRKWGDGNGYSHVRASLLGASLVVPFTNKKLTLGTWQQIVVVDFDNRPRSREIIIQVMGE